MKNQYFGDVRDLFKYDLIIYLIKNIEFLKRFTFIPMLTKNDHATHGGLIKYHNARAGHLNKALVDFLLDRVKKDKRNILELNQLFDKLKIPRVIYKAKTIFTARKRKSYFQGIGKPSLSNALIFVDPDNGLEVKHMRQKEKYVLYREITGIIRRMGKNSVLMIYQHIPRKNRRQYFQDISNKILRETGQSPQLISDNSIVFFLLCKKNHTKKKLCHAVNTYFRQYGKKLFFS